MEAHTCPALLLHFGSRAATETIARLGRGLADICSVRSDKMLEQFCPVCWTCRRSREQETQKVWRRQEWLAARCRRCQVRTLFFFAGRTLVLTVFYKRSHEKVLPLASRQIPRDLKVCWGKKTPKQIICCWLCCHFQ